MLETKKFHKFHLLSILKVRLINVLKILKIVTRLINLAKMKNNSIYQIKKNILNVSWQRKIMINYLILISILIACILVKTVWNLNPIKPILRKFIMITKNVRNIKELESVRKNMLIVLIWIARKICNKNN